MYVRVRKSNVIFGCIKTTKAHNKKHLAYVFQNDKTNCFINNIGMSYLVRACNGSKRLPL